MTTQHTVPAVPESAWFKSSHSSGEGGQCVEVATMTDTVHVRDSKNLTGPMVSMSPTAWSSFVELVSGPSA